MLPTGTVTLLLADVEGSTRLWQGRPTEMQAAMAMFNATVDEVIASFGGARPLEQGEGDSFVAGFARAADAVAAALEIQIRSKDDLLSLRMGIHTGDIVAEGDRYDGPTIIRAARIRNIGHGGQVLVSSSTVGLTDESLPEGCSYLDLGSHRLKGLDRAERVSQLQHPSLPARFAPLRSEARTGTLPIQLTTFIGRTEELADVKRLVRKNRMVTITGAGGCGKTRLAIEALGQLDAVFEDVWFCDLAPLADPDYVPATLRDALGLSEGLSRSIEDVICDHLAGRDAVVVIDNCEHLVDATARLADMLVRRCSNLHVVATSREPLGVAGEVAWRVPSLEPSDALELFAERAERATSRVAITERNAGVVADICRRLDGIPLAIELAAARLSALTVEQIAEGLQDRFRMLGRGARTVLARQQTLLASVGWSHDLLTEPQRVVLRRLSVFAGAFPLDAARAVAGGDGINADDVLDLLTELVDRSLVVADDTTIEPRFRLLETIRQFARDRLVDAGEADEVALRHVRHHLSWLQTLQVRQVMRELRQLDIIALVDASYDDLRAGVEWAIASGNRWDGLAVANSLAVLAYTVTSPARVREVRRWLIELLGDEGPEPTARIGGLLSLTFVCGLEEYDLAVSSGREALALARQAGNQRLEALALVLLGTAVGFGEPAAGRPLALEGIRIAADVGDLWVQQIGSTFLSQTSRGFAGPEAVELASEGLRLAESTGTGEDHARLALGCSLLTRGDVEAGRSQLEAARTLYELEGNESWVAKTDGTLAGVAIWTGDVETARPLLASSMEQTQRLEGDVSFMIPFILGASLEAYERNIDASRRIMDEGLSLLEGLPPGAIRSASMSAMLATRATLAALAGDRAAARAGIDAAAVEVSPQAWVSLVAGAYAHLAGVAVWLDEIAEAESYVHASLERIRTDEAWLFAVDLLTMVAGLRARVGAGEDAVRFAAAADAFGQRMGIRALRHPMWDAKAEVERLREVLGEGPFDVLWTSGAMLSLTDAVDLALKGRGPRQRPQSGWDSLTPTEHKVVELVAEGMTNPRIAEKLFISKRTVSTHLSHVFAKLGVASRSELASAATKRGVGS